MFATIAAIVFIFLATAWSKDSWFNTCLKVGFAILSVWACVEALAYWGFIIAREGVA